MRHTEIIEHNFKLHATKIPSLNAEMQVFHSENLSYVDANLSCDTFNIIHIHQNETTKEELLSAITYYNSKKLAFCIWVNDENLNDHLKSIFSTLSIKCHGEELGMLLELEQYTPTKNKQHKYITPVKDPQTLSHYANVIASHWEPKDENVLIYYQKTANDYLDIINSIGLFVYYHNAIPAATVELFPTDEKTMGIYGLATLEKFRGNGIGSALMSFSLNFAKQKGYKQIILQATEDGYGIYQKLGFKTFTKYYEYA